MEFKKFSEETPNVGEIIIIIQHIIDYSRIEQRYNVFFSKIKRPFDNDIMYNPEYLTYMDECGDVKDVCEIDKEKSLWCRFEVDTGEKRISFFSSNWGKL
jgi:hypothetical protein